MQRRTPLHLEVVARDKPDGNQQIYAQKRTRAANCNRELATQIESQRKGVVTSVHVFEAMRQAGIDLSGHDPRWMGQVSARQISNASALRVLVATGVQ